MNKITDWNIINKLYKIYQNTDRPLSKSDIYKRLLNVNLINPNGTPSTFAIKTGMIGKNKNYNYIDQKTINKIDNYKGIMNLKYIDPLIYYSIQDKATSSSIQRLVIDLNVQHTWKSYINIIKFDIKIYMKQLKEMIKVLNGKKDKAVIECKKNREKDIIDSNKFYNDLDKYPTEFSVSDWYEYVVWSKIIEWQIKDNIPSKLTNGLKDQFKYGCRGYIHHFQPQYRDNVALDAVRDSVNDAKTIWKCCNMI